MERNRETRIVAIAALIVAVLGLSVGFAAFSSTLTISSSATVTTDPANFVVGFSSSNTSDATDAIIPTVTPAGLVASSATITNGSESKLTGIHVDFTQPGQEATYTFYVHNKSSLNAFLKSVIFENVENETSPKVCTAIGTTTPALVSQACEGVSLGVNVGGTLFTGSQSTVSGHNLPASLYEEVDVTVKYAANASIPDGSFTVAFGDLVLNYSTVD